MQPADAPVRPRPVQWGAALRALAGLARDSGRTDYVFAILAAVGGDALERTYQTFRRTPHGERLLRERPSLMALLSDRARLEAMPDKSLGREYLRLTDAAKISAKGLVDAQGMGIDPEIRRALDPDRRYVADRVRDMHDLWHVLTEYGTDDTGEIANLWFSVGQLGHRGMAFIAFFGVLGGTPGAGLAWPRYCYRAWLRGRRAAWLASEPLEEMLDRPVDEVRRRVRIAPTSSVHPEGIRRGYRREGRLGRRARASS